MKKIEDYTIGEVIKNCKNRANCAGCPFCYENVIYCLFSKVVKSWDENFNKCNGTKIYKIKQKEALLAEFDKLDFIPTAVCANETAVKEWRESLSKFLDYILE